MTPNILLVEDNTAENKRLTLALQNSGYRVMSAESLSGARSVLVRSTADLAIVSTTLDAGVDLDLVHWLRQQAPAFNMPILVLAENCTVKARLASLETGADDYVSRPFVPEHLMCRVQNLLMHRESRPSVAPQGFARRILVVDDSPTYGYALSDALRKDGHDVAFAESGREALNFLERHKADAVVLDVFLPDINGVEVCRRIKLSERTAELPVLVLTGREKSAVRADAVAANADDFAVKSSDFETIRGKVRRLLVRSPNRKISSNAMTAVVIDSATARHAGSSSRLMAATPAAVDTSTVQHDTSSSRVRAAPVTDVAPNLQGILSHGDSVNGPSTADTLFEHIVNMTGLSELVARSTVESVCRRLELDPRSLQGEDLPRVIDALERTLRLFLPPIEAKKRLAALNTLTR